MPIPQNIPCTETEWIQLNKMVYTFYYDTYPLRESGIILPVPMDKLKRFYILDMSDRNLTPLKEYLNCYEYLFNYLVGRVSKMITFKGQNWWDRLGTTIPMALGKTYQQILSPFGVPLFVWLLGGLAVVVILKS